MLFSVCVPSYNRGHRAYELIQRLLGMSLDETQIEIICSNNGSDKNVEGYEELKKIRDKRFVYHEFSTNQGFAGNVNQVIKMSHGDFCMLLSDEDWILEENLEFYLRMMDKYPDIGVIRPLTGFAFADIEDCFAGAGKQAIDAFYMRGLYVSGMIFNRHIVTDQMIDEYAEKYRDNTGYIYYPHMFISTYALLRGHFFASDVWLVSEGETEEDLQVMDKAAEIPAYDAYDNVIKQMHGFIEHIKDLELPLPMQFDMLVMVFEQHAYLIRHRREGYEAGGFDYPGIMRLMAQKMKDELHDMKLPFQKEDFEAVCQFIDSITMKANEE